MELNKHYEALKEILDDQIKKIVKKGDITPQELDSLYKASAIVLDLETEKAMKKAEHEQMGGQSQDYSRRMSRGSYERGQSNHYPWFMYQNDGQSNNISNHGNSYAPVWNQGMEDKSMHEVHSNDSRNTYDAAYDGAYRGSYDGSYDGSYGGSYDGSYDASNDYSGRRGRDARGRYTSRDNRGYSRAMDKQRMIGKLEDMMDDAPSEKERRALQQCVTKLEQQ